MDLATIMVWGGIAAVALLLPVALMRWALRVNHIVERLEHIETLLAQATDPDGDG